MTRMQLMHANILAAQCQDLGLVDIDRCVDGTVWARLGTRHYHFAWDVTHQQVVLLGTWDEVQPWEICG